MYNIGIISEPIKLTSYDFILKLFQTLNSKYGKDYSISTGGNVGIDHYCKKLALELDLHYAEYNPSFTGHNMYSALPETYYGKKYHISHLTDRYNKLILNVDQVLVFISNNDTLKTFVYKQAISFLDKLGKNIILSTLNK